MKFLRLRQFPIRGKIYQVAPVSAITHYASISRMEPYEGTSKFKFFLQGDPIKLQSPVKLGENIYLKPQSPKYAKLEKILQAKTLKDVFPS